MEEVVLLFDGGVRNKIMAYGYLIVDPNNQTKIIARGNNTCGLGTSNVSEYRALIAGLKACIENKVKIVHIFGDSQLIIKQVGGIYKVNKPILKQHRDYIRELLKNFDDWSIEWIPRIKNYRADALVNEVFRKKFPKCKKKR